MSAGQEVTKTAFYSRFARHQAGQADPLKSRSTHYCAGCGHGLAHKYMAEAISELGVQDRTIAVSPVGCAVFLYYYFDTGNTQAPHGRAPVVALGHKLANPESVVLSYQGDGDLASIGLAEAVWSAQIGLPITIIFINNAIYGMTGGQLAPTTLMGQKTTTSPFGRDRMAGTPMKVAELMAQLDGPVYVERVALFDSKQRMRAKKAIKKAIQLQVEGKGFSLVEVLAECPTHLKLTPVDTEKWVKEKMLPIYPLGVKKDLTARPVVVAPGQPVDTPAAETWFRLEKPSFEPEKLLRVFGAATEPQPRFATGFPKHLHSEDVALKLAGAGGDGAQTAAMLIARAAISEGFDATHIPSYGPESRGGTSYADVHVAEEEVLSPAAPRPHILVAFNAPSLEKFAPAVLPGGTVLYDSSVIAEVPKVEPSVKLVGVPFTSVATGLGKAVVKNIVALGALQAATGLFPEETFKAAIRYALAGKPSLVALNETAFSKGLVEARQALRPQ